MTKAGQQSSRRRRPEHTLKRSHETVILSSTVTRPLKSVQSTTAHPDALHSNITLGPATIPSKSIVKKSVMPTLKCKFRQIPYALLIRVKKHSLCFVSVTLEDLLALGKTLPEIKCTLETFTSLEPDRFNSIIFLLQGFQEKFDHWSSTGRSRVLLGQNGSQLRSTKGNQLVGEDFGKLFDALLREVLPLRMTPTH